MKFLSVCSGIEAASVAFHPLGWKAVAFAEIEPFPCALLKHHYPTVPNLGDMTRFMEWPVWLLEQVDILVGGTPCFTAGHLVLTEYGYVPIQEVKPNDLVMTHQGRLRRVARIGSKMAAVGRLKGVGLPENIVCTEDHPFLSVDWKSQNTRRQGIYAKIEKCGDLQWTPAKAMPGKQWCAIQNYSAGELIPQTAKLTEKEAMYVAGMYLGDGHVRRWGKSSKKALVLSLNPEKMEKLRAAIPEQKFSVVHERTSVRAVFHDTLFCNWLLENFGAYSHLKTLPSWVYGHPLRATLLQGYLDTDGCSIKSGVSISTTSRALGYGVADLLNAEGHVASVALVTTPATCVIEGRIVNQRDWYQVRAFTQTGSRKSRSRNGYLLRAISSFEPEGEAMVYNIEVEEDHSYVINGAVVHNCQAFSIAGLRQSLTDTRGNLTLTFCLLYAHICKIRHAAGRPAPLFLWENVPGVLNTPDNAFGCFLAGLAGENGALRPPGGKWLDAGYVRGPLCSVAWRKLDAQYFGLAQRRERVFALGSVDPAFNPAEVLLEQFGVQRHSAPRREPGQNLAHDVAPCLTGSGRGVERGGDSRGQDPVVAERIDVCPPLTTSPHADNLSEEGKLVPEVAWCLQERDSKGPDISTKPGHLIPEICPTLLGGGNSTGGHRPPGSTVDNCESLIPEQMAFKASHFTRGKDGAPSVVTPPLSADADKGDQDTLVLAFDTTQITSPTNLSQPKAGDPCHPLAAGAHPPAIAFAGRMRGDDGRGYDRPPLVFGGDVVGAIDTVKPHCIAFSSKDHGGDATTELSPTLRAGNHDKSHANGGCAPAVAFQTRIARNGRGDMGELVNALQAQSGHSGKGDAAPCVAVQEAVGFKPRHYRLPNKDGAAAEISGPLTANVEHAGDCSPHAAYSDGVAWRVRRLTPEECELLQGFPPGYTLIPGYSTKLRKGADLAQTIEYLRAVMPMVDEEQLAALAHSPDGVRYKALGNSWAVPVVSWVARRINSHIINHGRNT